MASFSKRGDRWRVQVRRKGYALCKTFATKAAGVVWARQIETQIDAGKLPEATGAPHITDLIDKYIDLRETSRPVLDTSNEWYMLQRLDRDLGEVQADRLTADRLVSWAKTRKADGAGPYTVNMELSKLGTVLKYAGSALRLTLPDAVGQARPLLGHLGLIGGGGKRERRPTEDELRRICEKLPDHFSEVVRFMVATAMRRGEVFRLQWADVDWEKRLILVRDRKDPRRKAGNDQWIPLIGEAWEIVQTRHSAKEDATIFTGHPQTLSKYFKLACDSLGIPDLHVHDLRHHGTSLLFEEHGLSIEQVALVTGHKSWVNLKRYVQLKPEDLHKKVKT